MHMYAKFDQNISCVSRFMNIFTNYLRAELMFSKPSSIIKDGFTFQLLGNVDVHMYAKFDRNLPCDSKIVNIFTNC